MSKITTCGKRKHEENEVRLLLNEINSQQIWMLNRSVDCDFFFNLLNHILFEHLVLFEHFDSVVLVGGRKFTQKDCTKCSLADYSEHLKIIESKVVLHELGLIRELLNDKTMEWSSIRDALFFFSESFLDFFVFFLFFVSVFSKFRVTSFFLQLKLWNDKETLMWIRGKWDFLREIHHRSSVILITICSTVIVFDFKHDLNVITFRLKWRSKVSKSFFLCHITWKHTWDCKQFGFVFFEIVLKFF